MIELPSKGKRFPAIFCVEFNQSRLVFFSSILTDYIFNSRPHLLAAGDEQGKVNVWHVSSKLKAQQTHEQETLDTIMEHLAT